MRVLLFAAAGEDRDLLVETLRGREHETEVTTTAEEAWEAYRCRSPSLLVLEAQPDDEAGLELCRRVRGGEKGSGCVILALTRSGGASWIEELLEAGADDHLLLPLDRETIDARLAVAEYRLRDRALRLRGEERLVYEVLHDPITDLAKPALLVDRLVRADRSARRRRNRLFGILYLKLDEGEVPDERVLVEISRRLEDCVRSIDTIARYGEDEFAILLDDLRDISDPTRVTSRIHHSLSQPIRHGDRERYVTASIGIALSVTGYRRPQELLENAKEAMELAKSQGPGRHQLFDPVLNARVAARVHLEERLRRAIERQELVVCYQPIVAVADRRVLGFEALLSWEDDEHGMVPPSTFVPVAEDTGLIHPLGWWVFERACRQLAEWRSRFLREPALTMSVNVSGRQFGELDVTERVEEALDAAGLDGRGVHIEITESTLMENVESTRETLERLKARAVSLHVDDFGTGYSSLSYLCRFPIDALKIDSSFIRQMSFSPENLEIVRTIVRLAKNLGMMAIAEGVENEDQQEILYELECEAAQGFHYSRNLSVEEATRLLETR